MQYGQYLMTGTYRIYFLEFLIKTRGFYKENIYWSNKSILYTIGEILIDILLFILLHS